MTRMMPPVIPSLMIGLLAAAAVALFWQVQVGEPARACGSGFDVVADRSGWEVWWAQDLDQATADRPSDLVRTRECPDAVNRRILTSAVLAGGAALPVLVVLGRPRPTATSGVEGSTLARVGRVATAAGVALTAAGMVAVVLLVADSESTLFLYTDRLVVAIVGLIALVPAVALALGGWALLAAARSDGVGDDDDD